MPELWESGKGVERSTCIWRNADGLGEDTWGAQHPFLGGGSHKHLHNAVRHRGPVGILCGTIAECHTRHTKRNDIAAPGGFDSWFNSVCGCTAWWHTAGSNICG